MDRQKSSTSLRVCSGEPELSMTTSARSVWSPTVLGHAGGREFFFAPAPRFCPGKPLFLRRVDQEKSITKPIPTGFEKQRRIEHRHSHPLTSEPPEGLLHREGNLRMSQPLQVRSLHRPFRRRRKHNTCQPSAIDATLVVEDRVAPPYPGRCFHLRLAQYLMPDLVGIQYGGPQRASSRVTKLFPLAMPPKTPITRIIPSQFALYSNPLLVGSKQARFISTPVVSHRPNSGRP